MTRNALRREADALGIVWCRWCGGELGQTPDDRGRHLDQYGCETFDDMTNEGDETDGR